MDIRAVVLDRDGVLADFDYDAGQSFFGPLLPITLQDISDAWEAWGKKVGFPRSLDEETIFFRGFWDALSDEHGVSSEVRRKLHAFDYTSCMFAFSDARPAIVEARQRGLRVGVLSNFTLASLDASLQAIGLADLIDVALSATVIGAAKPNPRAYLAIAEALKVSPDECLFFDNELDCVQGGKAVGMQAYLVDREGTYDSLGGDVLHGLSPMPSILDSA